MGYYHIKKSLGLLQLVFVDDLLQIGDDAFVLVVVLGHEVDGFDGVAVEIAGNCGASDHALSVEAHPWLAVFAGFYFVVGSVSFMSLMFLFDSFFNSVVVVVLEGEVHITRISFLLFLTGWINFIAAYIDHWLSVHAILVQWWFWKGLLWFEVGTGHLLYFTWYLHLFYFWR